MSKAAFSLMAFSIYMFALGLTLLLTPNLLLSIFKVPATGEVWIRVVGMLAVNIGILYLLAARKEMTNFIGWTVYVRLSVPLYFTTFVALGLAPPVLIIFGIVDAAAALWTANSLRSDRLLRRQAETAHLNNRN